MDNERDVLKYAGLVRVYNLMVEPRKDFAAALNFRISRINDYCADRCYFAEDYATAFLELQRKVDEFGRSDPAVQYCDINFSHDAHPPSEKTRP